MKVVFVHSESQINQMVPKKQNGLYTHYMHIKPQLTIFYCTIKLHLDYNLQVNIFIQKYTMEAKKK